MTEVEETSSYKGATNNGRMEGNGVYTFPTGTVYTGELLDGEFHGEGTLTFPDCGKYVATWERGKVVRGEYFFADGLAYVDPADAAWGYCQPNGDRRFYTELVNGLRPAGDSQLANKHPPRKVPAGCYDVGDGFLNRQSGKVFAYGAGETELRDATQEEEQWATEKCRFGTE